MSAVDAAWLTLREPHDHAARSAKLADRFAASVGAAPRLIDLGCGTGSNLRYLAPRIPGAQHWLCVDHDPALLEAARTALPDWGDGRGWQSRSDCNGLTLARPHGEIAVGFVLGDLSRDALPDRDGADGLSASALLDLTSAAWLDRLAAWCRRMPVLMALSFDGRLGFEPAAQEDRTIRERFVAHQRTEKGFGPALGPDAAPYLADRLTACGHEVVLEPADWRLGPKDRPLLGATLEGIVRAAREMANDPSLERWATRRRQQLAAGDLRLTIGHLDLLALPGVRLPEDHPGHRRPLQRAGLAAGLVPSISFSWRRARAKLAQSLARLPGVTKNERGRPRLVTCAATTSSTLTSIRRRHGGDSGDDSPASAFLSRAWS